MTTRQVADRDNCSDRYVRLEIVAGRLAAYTIGRKSYRITEQAYLDWVEARRVVPRHDAVAVALSELGR
jgi:excisionase family DNA binding protein